MKEQRITKVEIAARMQSSCVQVDRLLDPKKQQRYARNPHGGGESCQPQAMP
jgi:hypothetical protein